MEIFERGPFLNLAALVEGGLIVVALGLAWAVGIDPLQMMNWGWEAVGWGFAATVPPLVLFAITYRYPVGPLRKIKRFLIEMLGPPLAACRWYDLLLLGLLAGFSEELLFRGVLQPWIENAGGLVAGLLVSNLLFGLAHAVTVTYAILAGAIGIYLGLLLHITDEPNLLIPMMTHGFYDYIAFLVVARSYRSEQSRDVG